VRFLAGLGQDARKNTKLADILQGLRTKSLKNQIGDSFAEERVQRGAFSFAAQGAFAGACLEKFGGGLPEHGQILRCRFVPYLAMILMISDIKDVMALIFQRPMTTDELPEALRLRGQTAQIIMKFLRRSRFGMPLAQGDPARGCNGSSVILVQHSTADFLQ